MKKTIVVELGRFVSFGVSAFPLVLWVKSIEMSFFYFFATCCNFECSSQNLQRLPYEVAPQLIRVTPFPSSRANAEHSAIEEISRRWNGLARGKEFKSSRSTLTSRILRNAAFIF